MLKNKNFKKFNLSNNKDYSSIRLTVDEPEDFKVIKNIITNFKNNLFFSFEDIIYLYKKKKNSFFR